jgi:RNA polymerase sigma-70 factor (ECF subfamily)
MAAMTEDADAPIRVLAESGDVNGAATIALETFGPEVLGWLAATTRNVGEAEDAFGAACEDFWRSFASFRWQCSLRAWLYTLARHALSRQRKVAAERAERKLPLSQASVVADRVRSRTAPWLRTDVKDRFAALRDELSEDDRALLILRIDRDLPWQEIAQIVGEDGDGVAIAARLRKRFQTIKEKLRELGRARGLLGEGK